MRTRLERATDKRDDARQYAHDWGWAWKPSQTRRAYRAYLKADARVVRLGGTTASWPRGVS